MSRLLKLKGSIEWHRAVSIDPLVLADEDLDYVMHQAERTEELERRNKELEYASRYNGELNEFLQKRNLPPSTLGRHVVDVVMDYVEGLEKDIENYKKACVSWETVESYSRKEAQRYKQALEFASDELYQAYITGDIGDKESRIREAMERVDEALEGEK